MLPTARSASANAAPASAAIRNASRKPKPPRLRVTWNRISTEDRSITPYSTLPAISTTNDVRYCAWLRTCAAASRRYAYSAPSPTLDHHPALGTPLHVPGQREHDHGPDRLAGDRTEGVRRRVPLDQHVGRHLDQVRERCRKVQRRGHRRREERQRERHAAER